jgi:hypothetical protein
LRGHDRPQQSLSLDQRSRPHVFPVEPQQIEGVKDRLSTAPKQLVKLRLAGSIEADYFRRPGPRYGRAGPMQCTSAGTIYRRFIDVAAAGDELAVTGLNVRQRAEAVVL